MADRSRRARDVIRWALTIAVVIYAAAEWGSDEERKQAEPSEDATASELRIVSISDADVTPGDAVVVRYEGADEAAPLEARIAKHPADILVREPGSVVVRIPHDLPTGKAALRLLQGPHKSKAWDLHIRTSNHRKLIGRLLGGLALFIYGLGLLAAGVRGLAGRGLRTLLGRLTSQPTRAVGVGVLVGGATQLTSSAAALVVSLVEARLLALGPAVAIFVGAQLGASITGALIPVGLARESLLVIVVGVLWTRLAFDRRGVAVGQVVLGAGLMLYGLHLLQTSIEPLVGDPKLLPYVGYLRASDVGALVTCAATGALLAFVLQGPGPVYVLVIGLARSSGALPLENALAILAGTNLGAALGMALIAWQSSRATRPLARPQLAFGLAVSILAVATIPLWTAASAAMVPDGHRALAHGHAVIAPEMATQLALGFSLSQLAVTLSWLVMLPPLERRAAIRPTTTGIVTLSDDALAEAIRRRLIEAFDRQRFAVDTSFEISCTGDRGRAAASEEALVTARRALEAQIKSVGAGDASLERLARTTVAALQLQRVVEQLAAVAELGVERGLRLATDEQDRLRAMHELVRESFGVVIAAIERGAAPDLEEAGAREIRMNLLEAEARRAPAFARRKNDSASVQLGLAELVDTYEHVGNHLFRTCKAMADEGDDLAA